MSTFTLEPCTIVIVGASGDLAQRKLVPALAKLDEQGYLPGQYRILATSRRELDAGDFKRRLVDKVDLSGETLERFASHIEIVGGFDPDHGAGELAGLVNATPGHRRLFYAATPPDQFAPIAAAIGEGGLLQDDSPLVLEKPLGTSLDSYRQINAAVARHVPEKLIYRIDHYLGKETVQNLLCLRFANLIFESLWDRSYIDHVQITVAEQEGVAGRAGYYDGSGAVRDMVQNHLMQLLCLIAMEQPRAYDPDCVRDEKLKVLQSLAPLETRHLALGQYQSGLIAGDKADSYAHDTGATGSATETFAALKVHIGNWRWAGVPFYLRTGKRLPVRESLIVVNFKNVPHSLFPDGDQFNQIIIRLQPNEAIELVVNNKVPGPGGMRLRPNRLNLNLASKEEPLPEAYERLLLDALRGKATLYMRHDEVEASWGWIEPAIAAGRPAVEPYAAGTWGPDSAQIMLARDNRRWVNPATL